MIDNINFNKKMSSTTDKKSTPPVKKMTSKKQSRKTIKRKKTKTKTNYVYVSKCVCHKNMWCDNCYGEYDLFD